MKAERWAFIVIPLSSATGLSNVHYTWGATFVIEALLAICDGKHYVMMDHDAAPPPCLKSLTSWNSGGNSQVICHRHDLPRITLHGESASSRCLNAIPRSMLDSSSFRRSVFTGTSTLLMSRL